MPLTMHPDLKSLIAPLSPEEYAQLEANLLKAGCRDALIVWQEEQILLDGHHRYAICERHTLPYTIQEITLPSLDAARLWMIQNQLGRRNLTEQQASYFRGAQYELQKKISRGGGDHRSAEAIDQKSHSETFDDTATRLAKEYKVSRSTMLRDSTFADAIDTLAEALGPDVRQAILAQTTPITREGVRQLATLARTDGAAAERAWMDLLATETAQGAREALARHLGATQCGICHRPLSDPASMQRGIGPICAGHGNGAQSSRGGHAVTSPQREAVLVLEPEEGEADDPPLAPEVLPPSRIDQVLQAAMGALETLEGYYRATPHLFELHQVGTLALTEACRRFAALVDPEAPPAPAPQSDPAPSRELVGLQQAVWRTVQALEPCTPKQVAKALRAKQQATIQALQALVQQGTVRQEGLVYRVVDAPQTARSTRCLSP